MSKIQGRDDSPPPPGWSRGQRRLALGLIGASAILNLVDRQIISILIEPIKREFHVSDFQIGLLSGVAFALCYAVVAFPVARLLDVGVRRSIYAAFIGIWSLSTMLAGMATSFAMLLATRVGVAVGESSSTPAQQSLVADLYPGARLTMATAFVTACSAIGVALSLFLGGWITEHFGWRAAFLSVGAPGILVALGMRFLMREPPRRTIKGEAAVARKEPLSQVLPYLWSLKSYRLILLAVFGANFSGFANLAWAPSLLIRVHGMTPSQVGLWFGLASAVAYGLGSLLAGYIITAMVRRDLRWYLRLPGIFNLLAAPAGLLAAFAPSPALTLLGMFLFMCCLSFQGTAALVMNQSLALPHMRATAGAAYTLVLTLGGVGLGPLVMGLLNDTFGASHGAEGIRQSMALVMIGAAVAGLACLLGNRWLPGDYARSVEGGRDAGKAPPPGAVDPREEYAR